jgi:hypothetical protein
MFIRSLALILGSLFSVACSAAEPDTAAQPDTAESGVAESSAALTKKQFVDAGSFFVEDAEIEAWYALTARLKTEFDDVCGDTFCEGDYSNYESLGFRCSVEEHAGTIGQCVWIFGASQDEVVATTGHVKVTGKIWRCPLPIPKNTPATLFVHSLAAAQGSAIHALVPGSQSSLYDALSECL